MAVTVVVWNVETFGDRWDAARGANYTPICNFMAQALYAVSADVFIMMELRRGGAQHLPTIQAALVAQSGAAAHVWNYDYIPGSVLANSAYPIGIPAQLGFTQQGHSEGYAVLWRNHLEFSVLSTRVAVSGNIVGGQSKIGLVFQGRTMAPKNVPNPVWFTAPDFNPPPPPWQKLDFPEPNPPLQGNTRWDLCRRSCCVVLDLNRPGPPVPRAQRLLPIVVHHATNKPYSTPWSVQSATYSAQLYQVDDTAQAAPTMVTVAQALAAGDFNIDHNDPTKWPYDAYDYFTNGFAGTGGPGTGGANLPTTWVNSTTLPRNYTAVRLDRRNGQPITAANVNNYRWLAIDNLFIRNLATVNPPSGYRGPVYNLLTGLKQNGFLVSSAAKRAIIQSFRTAIVNALGPPLGGGFTNYRYINPANNTPCNQRKRNRNGTYSYYGPVIGNLLNYNAYMNDLQRGYFSTARRAAEFYWNSISDHLPLVYRFTV
jgi:hypothetical protein